MRRASRDAFGFERIVYRPAGDQYASTIRALLERDPSIPRRFDKAAVMSHLQGRSRPDRSLFEQVHVLPPGHDLVESPRGFVAVERPSIPQASDLGLRLLAAIESSLRLAQRPAVALSGGLDSALLLALVHQLGRRDIPAYILAAEIEGYNELDAARATAQAMDAEVVVVRVDAGDFAAALPEAVRSVEEPIYNGHPVAKLLLARAMKQDGVDAAISGDGADQVLTRDDSANYLPLCRSLFDAAGVALHAPFLDSEVVAHLLSLPPDPDKQCLRSLAAPLPVPRELIRGRKTRRLLPPLDLDRIVLRPSIADIAGWLGCAPPALDTDRERMLWTTLGLLVEDFGIAG